MLKQTHGTQATKDTLSSTSPLSAADAEVAKNVPLGTKYSGVTVGDAHGHLLLDLLVLWVTVV